MSKVLELAHSVGMQHVKEHDRFIVDKADLSKFYTLARADLEAENAKLRKALSPFVLANSSEEHMTLIVRTADITAARAGTRRCTASYQLSGGWGND